VTNGIAVRRWLKQSNPGLSALLTERLGHAWENDLEELERLRWQWMTRVATFRGEDCEQAARGQSGCTGVEVDPTLFDVQMVPRI
jgi:starch phosphorylase